MKKATYPSFLFIVMVLKLISYVFLEEKKKEYLEFFYPCIKFYSST